MAAYGTTINLVSGTITLPRPSTANFLFILNEDAAPMTVSFQNGSTVLGTLTLSAATATGAPGGYIDSIGFPLFFDGDSVVLTSTVTTAQFGSGQSSKQPTNNLQRLP